MCFTCHFYKSNKNGDISFTNFKYDNNNNLLEKVESPKKFYKITRNITDKIFELMQKEHSESYKHKYIYNENQLLIECELYLINNLIMSYEFEYKFYNEKDQK